MQIIKDCVDIPPLSVQITDDSVHIKAICVDNNISVHIIIGCVDIPSAGVQIMDDSVQNNIICVKI